MDSQELLTLVLACSATALVLLLAAWFWQRARHRAGISAGRAEREPELVALRHDLDAAARERSAIQARLDVAEQALAQARGRVDALSDQGAALAARAERVDGLERQLTTLRQELEATRVSREHSEARGAELRARLDEQQQAAAARYRDLEGAREQLKHEFQALAAGILEERAKRFGDLQEAQLGQLLNPLREQLGDFRRAVSDAYEKENNARVALQSRLDDLVRLNQTLGQEAQTLSRALSSDNRTQGYWGELKLERLLEAAGLEKGQQYLTQESFRDADGDRYRPDAVLKLPEGRDIVIDAKMTLVDYQRACESADPAEREPHLTRHVAALRSHIRQLGEKDYSRLEGVNAPDLVLLFVPVEGAFLDALRRDPSLYEFAFEKRIILVGPSNLLASLRLVAQIWRSEQQNRNAHLIADRAAKLYDKFVGFVDDLGKVGEALGRAQKQYDEAVGKLSQGRGNLIRQTEMLRDLGVSPAKRLAGNIVDLARLDDGDEAEASGSGPAANTGDPSI